ncbi:MAG: T9SS type A sorting domain-containing protein, partial [Candidatus Zophobacter franzmannii]|nr:T9SS type A sorting domain-containing protein [Candidatus Zophobacter franzmannii]
INGLINSVGIEDDNEQDAVYYRLNNYPNPFNPATTISFSLKEREMVTLSIYNLKGQKIRTLESAVLKSGQHSIIWSGDEQNGNVVSSGIYFYKLDTNSYSATKKMVMVK